MAIMIIDDKHLEDIADAIRGKNGTTDTYKPREMADAITALSSGGGTSGDAVANYPKITNVLHYTANDFEYYGPNSSRVHFKVGSLTRYMIDTSIYDYDVVLTLKYKYFPPLTYTPGEVPDGAIINYWLDPVFTETVVNENTIIDGWGVPCPTIAGYTKLGYIADLMLSSDGALTETATITIPANVNTVCIQSMISEAANNPSTGKMSLSGEYGNGRLDLYDFMIQGV